MKTSLLFLVSSLLAGPASSVVAAPSPEAEQPISVQRVALEVDHGGLLEHQRAASADKARDFVREDVEQALRQRQDAELVEDEAAPAIVIALGWKDYDTSLYAIEVAIRREGGVLEVVESFEARCVNNSALSREVLARVPAALERLAEEPAVEEPAVEEVVEVGGGDPPVAEAEVVEGSEGDGGGAEGGGVDETPGKVRLGVVGKVGIGMVVGGALALIPGGIMLGQKQKIDRDDARQADWEGRDYGPPGGAVLVVGGVVAVTGAVLLVVDWGRVSKAKRRVRVVPTGRGLAVVGRF